MNNLTTPAALASRWGVSDTLIYEMLNAGELPAFRLGRLWRIPIAAVEARECTANMEPSGLAAPVTEGTDAPPLPVNLIRLERLRQSLPQGNRGHT